MIDDSLMQKHKFEFIIFYGNIVLMRIEETQNCGGNHPHSTGERKVL